MDEFIYLNRTRVAIFSLSVRESAAFFEETERERERERESAARVVKLIFALDLYSIEISARSEIA